LIFTAVLPEPLLRLPQELLRRLPEPHRLPQELLRRLPEPRLHLPMPHPLLPELP